MQTTTQYNQLLLYDVSMSSTRTHSPAPSDNTEEENGVNHDIINNDEDCTVPNINNLQVTSDDKAASNGIDKRIVSDEATNELVAKNLELDKLKREMRVKNDSEEQMRQVLKEYEKTISDLILEKENEKQKMELDIQNAVSEKNQAIEDLHNVEAAFSDVHRKYERTKQVVEGFKKNEEQLKQCVEDYKEKLRMSDQKYNMLKHHAEEKLEEANKEIDKIARGQDAEKAKLNALVQKSEMKVRTLERTVAQKTKENEVRTWVIILKLNYNFSRS